MIKRFSGLPVTIAIALWLIAAPVWAAAEKSVTDPTGLFSFKLPAEFVVTSSEAKGRTQISADLAASGVFVTVVARDVPLGGNLLEKMKSNLAEQLGGVQFGDYHLCNRPGLVAVGDSVANPGTTVEAAVVQIKQIGIVLTMAYPTDQWTTWRPVLERMLVTFRCRLKR